MSGGEIGADLRYNTHQGFSHDTLISAGHNLDKKLGRRR